MGRYSVKRYKTKRRTKDLDLIHKDLSSIESITKLKNQEQDEYKPGLGQYYCIHCDKYFQDNKALASHLKMRVHKRRVKELAKNPYTQLESDAASGTNLVKFMSSVEKYKNLEPERLNMEKNLLKDLVSENDEKDKIRHAMLYPDENNNETEQVEGQQKQLTEEEQKQIQIESNGTAEIEMS
ncbi:hypothetical protein B5S28_g1038 [[Candida] boidinii]|uniref:Unnamed protein product n=1 Tax=Candida boidinii TaxID=5477 RepID=A0ACB5TLK5_CANBO|nr:hypothetical protein B5S28_g1038 [[Candida] boidinii]OWB61619.1 hypothetical protein B5S29_g2516 [[Candida] boidinii]OWB73733.1 hypothetical protein B5S31_g3492 [[Candida] boidinii]OWB77790.1 hypothetical protein B5S32_g1967 [[Candida] boidinii]GME86869.1 unnamed protein product [[Candida] boidinii]